MLYYIYFNGYVFEYDQQLYIILVIVYTYISGRSIHSKQKPEQGFV